MENRFILSKVHQTPRATRYIDLGRFPTKEHAVKVGQRMKEPWVVTERIVVATSETR